jgi:hypothetical protein
MPGEKKQSRNVRTMLRKTNKAFRKGPQEQELKPKGKSKKIRQCKK